MPVLNPTPPDTQAYSGATDPVGRTTTTDTVAATPYNDEGWLKLASASFRGSTQYFEIAYRRQLLNNLRQFQGLFPVGSKYLSDAYRAKSKFFRPKTRAAVRSNEAMAADAFFSSMDVVKVSPQDTDDAIQAASAELMKQLLEYRLTAKGRSGIPWFLIACGACQDAQVQGVVCSYQYWQRDKRKGLDRPQIKLRPIENIRFDPNSDWFDPVNTSPYFIEMIPMYIKDVVTRMTTIDEVTQQPLWRPAPKESLLKAATQYSDVVRLQREQGRIDPRTAGTGITEYSVVWVHRNIIEVDGQDWVFHTLETSQMLDDPQPLEKVWFHGRRPYVVGFSVIETHRPYPNGNVALVADIQGELNENANQRSENVKLVLNKRYLARRAAQVDTRSLSRNVAGSTTFVGDVEKDVKVLDTGDITSSAYQEQDRLNLDFDDLSGSFSQASVQANRKLNETVGGMNILTKSASSVSGYQLRTFVETWAEPVMEQLVLLEQRYETDETVLALAGKKANLFKRFGVSEMDDELMMQDLIVTVNVGVGAVAPHDRLQNFMEGLTALKEVLDDGTLVSYGIDVGEVTKEVFGNLGYKDGKRFFPDVQDPRLQAMQAEIQKLQQQLTQKKSPEEIDATVRKLLAQVDQIKAQTVKEGVTSAFEAIQTAEVIATVPGVAPVADRIMQASGYQEPQPPGVDPNLPAQAPTNGEGLTLAAIKNPKTGVQLQPRGNVVTPATQNTHPNFPPNPAAPGSGAVGAGAGIETARP
jgi:hypothetical protein